MVRAGPLHGQGRGFESLILHQSTMPKGRSSLLPFNYMLWIFRLIPFAVPPLMGLQEEICGRIMWLNYAMLTLFLASLITLYVWGIISAVTCRKQGPLWYELFLFHVVRIPLFVMAWFIYMVAFAIIIFWLCHNKWLIFDEK